MKTIRQLAAQSGLSRTTLLYYDRLGLLRPEYRTAAGHRLYSPEDEARLARICELRRAGLPLSEIDAVLEPSQKLRAPLGDALNRRLSDLNREIAALRRQQQVALALLRDQSAHGLTRAMTKERWVQLLTACGLDEKDRDRWHAEFEKLSPEAHQDFLESLGLPADEIAAIRHWSARAGKAPASTKTALPATRKTPARAALRTRR
ncbi:MAG TPA: MerR family transcriptional regulator [Opitutaceae bacterium]|nr:MerR family transcriptional regulator [Opitutaceae bacterium]